MIEVVIVGIGMYEFGCIEGVLGMDQGVIVVWRVFVDVGCCWEDMQFAFGGSAVVGVVDIMVFKFGFIGLQFINVVNGCVIGGLVLFFIYNTILLGMYDLGIVIGFDKHEWGAFRVDIKSFGLGDWYGVSGMVFIIQFFGMKINCYMHEYGIMNQSLVKVLVKVFCNGVLNLMVWWCKLVLEEEIFDVDMLLYLLIKYMFCSLAEGGVVLILVRVDQVYKYIDILIILKVVVVCSWCFGSFEVLVLSIADEYFIGFMVDALKVVFKMVGMEFKDIDLVQLQDIEVGAEIMHMVENGFCVYGEQEKMLVEGVIEINGCFLVNIDGGCFSGV